MSGRTSVTGPPASRSAATRRRLWLVVFAVVLAAQLVAVYSPGAPAGPEVSGLDKVVHVGIFAAPAFAGLMAGVRPRWLLALLALHAPVSELVQWAFLPHRDGDWHDAAADLGGVLLGWTLFVGWLRSRHW